MLSLAFFSDFPGSKFSTNRTSEDWLVDDDAGVPLDVKEG